MSKSRRDTALLSAFFFILLAGFGMAWMQYVDGRSYADPALARSYWWVEIALFLLCVVVVRRWFSWSTIGFGKLVWRETLWLLPFALILLANLGSTVSVLRAEGTIPAHAPLLALTFFVTALVGFNEEVMFRGILLHGFLTSGYRKRSAMLVSASGFSLLHSVNYLGGLPLPSVCIQMAFTFVFGLCFGPLAVRLGSLWPLIAIHALWDFALISNGIVGAVGSFLSILYVPVLLATAIALWIVTKDKRPAP